MFLQELGDYMVKYRDHTDKNMLVKVKNVNYHMTRIEAILDT